MRRSVITSLLLVFTVFASNVFSQNSSSKQRGKFILGVHENINVGKGKAPEHANLSFTLNMVGKNANYHELSFNNLGGGEKNFLLGLGYQYKWQWFKKSKFFLNPYVGFYNDVNFSSESIVNNDDEYSQFNVNTNAGIAPGLNAHIGRLYLDASVRLNMFNTDYSSSTVRERKNNFF